MYGTAMPFFDDAQTTGATAAVPANRPSTLAPGAYTGVNDASRTRLTVGTSNSVGAATSG